MQRVVDRFQISTSVFADGDDDRQFTAVARDIEAPAPGFDGGDRLGLADRPACAVGVDPGDRADAQMMVVEVGAADAMDPIPWPHRSLTGLSRLYGDNPNRSRELTVAYSRRKVTTSTSRCPGPARSSGTTGVTP